MEASDAKRLKELERESSRSKKIVAEQAINIHMLKEVNSGNF
jgi:predicted transcriptional regulator